MDINQAILALKKIKGDIHGEYHLKEMGIFGSFARRENINQSDLDILVSFEKPIDLFKFIELEQLLSSRLNLKVDLVNRSSLKKFIGKRIIEEVIYV